MENNYFALLANDVKKLWNGLDDGEKYEIKDAFINNKW